MKEFDSIIIGSGVGGLATAICLAKAGQKVLVLEQHYVPGGWSHSFTLNGQRFSPGVHYVGLVEEGQSTHGLYSALGIANDLVFFRMNKEAYEHCLIGNQPFDLPAGLENLKDQLCHYFPKEEKNIREYLSLVQKVNEELQLIPKLKGLWQKLTVPFRTKHFGKFALFPLKKVIGWHIKDATLKSVLNIQCGDHGLPPKRACFPVHCSVMGHYFNGGFYPMGGGGGIIKAMTNGVKKHGGEIRVKQNVAKILIENKKAVGVQLKDGQQIFAKNIISNADPSITYLNLIGKEHLSNSLIKKLKNTKYSVTSLILFLTLDMDVTLYGIDSGNIWMMKDENDDANFDDLMSNTIAEGDSFPALFMSCTTLKDPPSFNGRYHNFEIVTYVNYDHIPNCDGSDDYHSEEYMIFKEKVIGKLMNNVEKVIPNAKKHIIQAELGTPKTNEFYINSSNGNVYGTEKTLNQVGPFAFKNKSEIENLFLCGASTLSHGVTGASFSGVSAAAAILDCHIDDLLVANPDQKIRIYDAEDPDTWPEWVHVKRSDKMRKFV
ncbi:NAD(P)/FAD-dependent oxidoreductase [Flavobacterium sp. Fl-77]|uniref:NAD(P)/FAD-dependent oxidoreductase n=1 Tax=Flavobacterium flavipigmentatum TaxID=2893884 RepID=A0AAJ2SDR9_9FLAO|nr:MULTISPECIES: NAD(P)/FAD-dependent oxidoreductase [unclassified Flavobacterium]MDX6181050.1 NAD(P)/FAD-dependent oxidoreductase [Flavobacterium sp. Fl-33]MDX6184651.1 NAD(P)/FAD-dependent oxidoreductase [Flavobacterium sp. Fl-77]UFH39753.1 NAD(P)/FAD-dependent oxidoreductase [Flavobacterium sp. F-70]